MRRIREPRLSGAARAGRKLTNLQARFILDCLTVNFHERREAGFKSLKYGIYQKLARKFGVSPDAIKDIRKRRSFAWLPITNIYNISLRHRRSLLEGDKQ